MPIFFSVFRGNQNLADKTFQSFSDEYCRFFFSKIGKFMLFKLPKHVLLENNKTYKTCNNDVSKKIISDSYELFKTVVAQMHSHPDWHVIHHVSMLGFEPYFIYKSGDPLIYT